MTEEKKVKLIRMSEVELQPVDWLWYPYLPFGKITMIQGDPGEGKTTLALRLAAACSAGAPLPGANTHELFPVLYQTAEDYQPRQMTERKALRAEQEKKHRLGIRG